MCILCLRCFTLPRFPKVSVRRKHSQNIHSPEVIDINKIDMKTKKNFVTRDCRLKLTGFAFLAAATAIDIQAQMSMVPVPTPEQTPAVALAVEDFTWWYISLFVLALGLVGAVMWVVNNKKENKKPDKTNKKAANSGRADQNSLDANVELEWLRKNQNLMRKGVGKSRLTNSDAANRTRGNTQNAQPADSKTTETETAEKILPVFLIERLELARPFANLPISNDEALMSAIEQTYDEFEEDEEIRDLALRILTAFKTRNSVEALAQMALYDLSSILRSKAVSTLSDFNHESVFETILQATADPTREVRAAAARAMSKLTIDRADAWSRISESEEEGRMRQAARAATESGFVEMSFDRLIHPDEKYSYEAVALTALLIKAGETGEIFRVLESHKDMNVRRAVLHVIKITKDQKALDGLYALLERKNLPLELQEEVDKTIEEIGFVTV